MHALCLWKIHQVGAEKKKNNSSLPDPRGAEQPWVHQPGLWILVPDLCCVLHYTCTHRTIIYRCNERKPDQMSLWEQGRHMTNTKIKTLGNKANTESKKWEWGKYWIKTNTAADSNVNSDRDSEVWSMLTIEDEGLRQEAKNLLDFSSMSLYYLTRLT